MGQLNSNTPFTRSANFREGLAAAVLVSLWLAVAPARGEERQAVRAQVAEMVAHLPLQARLPAANRLELAIGLPLRNQGALSNLLRQLYTPRNTNFHRFLTPEQFAERFGPTEQDYQSVISYAKSNRFEVLNTFGNRALVVVSGSVADIERTFQVRLGTYRHPTENREFYAPDAAPSVAAGLSVLYLSGFVGTSLSSPLWAGVCALVNQQAAAEGKPPVGLLNPALYAIGQGATYAACFNDITNGNNAWNNTAAGTSTLGLYSASVGYDLCTGWGSPHSTSLIDTLLSLTGPVFVDFNYTGPTSGGSPGPAGSYDYPFKTMALGVSGVNSGGTIFIKTAGSSSETMTISKPMTINASDGAASIGRH